MNTTIIPIILAAGRGSRFGRENKLLYNLYGKPMIQHSLEIFLELFEKVVIVLGNDKETMINFLNSFNKNKINYISNNNWEEGGMSSSVKIGIKYVDENFLSLGVLIHPGDIPLITKDDIESILNTIKKSNYKKVVIPQYRSKNGHPLFIPKNLFSEIYKINESSEGLKGFLKGNSTNIFFANCGKGILKDIDSKVNV